MANDAHARLPEDSHITNEPFNVDNLITRLLTKRTSSGEHVPLSATEITELCKRFIDVLKMEPMLVEVKAPVFLCGDIHGQFDDLLRVFSNCGQPPQSSYVFMGDFVDRGKQSLEVLALLYAYKIKYPSKFWVLRGNHENATINRVYGFFDEVTERHSTALWETICETFKYLPPAALVNKRILCMHGGLSPDLKSLDLIREMERPIENPPGGLLCDLVWSDPNKAANGWAANKRGISFSFGADVVKKMCDRLEIDLVCRAHQVIPNGFEYFADRKLITVFTAPNYCGTYGNCGAVLDFDKNLCLKTWVFKPAGGKPFKPQNDEKVVIRTPKSA